MYDDLKRTRHKLTKPHVYVSHGRSSRALAVKSCSLPRRNYVLHCTCKKRCSGLPCASSDVDQDAQFIGYLQFCQVRKPVNTLRNRLMSRIAIVSRLQCLYDDDLEGGTSSFTHSHYEVLSHCLSAAIFGDSEETKRFFRLLCLRWQDSEQHDLTGSVTDQIISSKHKSDERVISTKNKIKITSATEPAQNIQEHMGTETAQSLNTAGNCVEWSQTEANTSWKVERSHAQETGAHNDTYVDGYLSPRTQATPCISFSSEGVLEPIDINYLYEFTKSSQPSVFTDREDILPCLNHNTSLTCAPDAESSLNGQFPCEQMLSLCSGYQNEFETDFLNEHCIVDLTGESSERSLKSPDQDFIDTMIDTYTLSKAHDSQSTLNGVDGARGDGLHFNLGLHQSWWSSSEGLSLHSRKAFSISTDPTPQDRLARITYKTQPSDAAQAPMFVFSPVSNHTDKTVSSSKAIPLDFNLNAVYKLASLDERATVNSDSGYSPPARRPPEGVIGGTEVDPSVMEELETKRRKVYESSERNTRTKMEKAKAIAFDNKKEEVSSTSRKSDQRVMHTSKPYIFIPVLVALLATILILCTKKDCFSQLFWEILVHLFLVGIILVLIITALEANNLTELAVQKLQSVLIGEQAVQETSRHTRSSSDTSEDTSPEVLSDQLFFDSQSSQQDEAEAAGETESKKIFQEMKKLKQIEHCMSTQKQFLQDVLSAQLQGKLSGGDSVMLKRNERSDSEIYSVRNTNVCSNPENSGTSSATTTLSSFGSDSRFFYQATSLTARRDVATSSQSVSSVAQTMTDLVILETSSTQTEDLLQDYLAGSTIQIIEINPGFGSVQTASVSVQAEMDAKKIYQQTEKLQQKHQLALKRLQRKFLSIRRRCQMEAMNLKQRDRSKNELLCKLQLSLPTLQKEKNFLMAERVSIDKQFEEEKKKNRELVGRLTRLNQQFYRLGQIQQPPPTPSSYHWRQQYQHQTYHAGSSSRAHCDQISQLQQQQKTNLNQSPQVNIQQHAHPPQQMQHKIQQQSTLLQNPIRPNSFISSSSQSQSLQHHHHHQQQQQPAQQQMFHQHGLPVFQLFNNKTFCQPYLEAHLQQQQQQQQQQQLHHQKMQQ